MQSSHTPLSVWFCGAYLLTTQTPGISALQFQRQLGIGRYETAFTMLHKLRAGMVRPDRDTIGGEHVVEVDECFLGGKTRDKLTTIVGAIEVCERRDADERAAKWKDAHKGGIPAKKLVYAGRLRLRALDTKDAASLNSFVMECVTPGTHVRTDGASGYRTLAHVGYRHDPLVLGGNPDKAEAHLPMIHLVFSNLKTWLLGTHHGRIEPKHLQAYLNEYVFRFNRRFYPMNSFASILGLAARSPSPTYEQLYSGQWQHPYSMVAA